MSEFVKKPAPNTSRMRDYRRRLREAGLRPVQIWVPDTRSPEFAELCRQQSLAVAAGDPAGDELMQWVEQARDWPR